jgi:hypothetical protein
VGSPGHRAESGCEVSLIAWWYLRLIAHGSASVPPPWLLEELAVPDSARVRLTLFTLAEAFRSENRPKVPEAPRRPLSRRSSGQVTCAHVLRLTAAQADTSLMPNSAASCR